MDKSILTKLDEKCKENAEEHLATTCAIIRKTFCDRCQPCGSYIQRLFEMHIDAFISDHYEELLAGLKNAEEDEFFHQLKSIESLLIRQGLIEREGKIEMLEGDE